MVQIKTGTPNESLAAILTANVAGTADIVHFGRSHQGEIQALLSRNGAVLFRGFGVASVPSFRAAVLELFGPPWSYIEGSSERKQIGEAIYTSTQYPAEYSISLHNELSYTNRWPKRLCFSCVEPAPVGGQTPLADSRNILRAMPEALVAEFEARGICYIRNLRSEEVPGLGLSWQAVWETEHRADVETYCNSERISFQWRENGTLTTTQTRPATAIHPQTREKVWFNQADQFHPSNLGREAQADLIEYLGPDALPLNATFGDGGPIPEEMLKVIREVCWAEATLFDWQTGDFLVLDNVLIAHGRMPFQGPRNILVAMA